MSLLSLGLFAQNKYLAAEIGLGFAKMQIAETGPAYYGGVGYYNPAKKHFLRFNTLYVEELNLIGPARNKQTNLEFQFGMIQKMREGSGRIAVYSGFGIAYGETYGYEVNPRSGSDFVNKFILPAGLDFYVEKPNTDIGLGLRGAIARHHSYIGAGIILRFKTHDAFSH